MMCADSYLHEGFVGWILPFFTLGCFLMHGENEEYKEGLGE